MNTSQVFILIAIIALAVVALVALQIRRSGTRKPLTPLTSLAFACIVAGIVFGENRFLGYGLMGLGVILSLIDMYSQSRGK